MSTNTQTAQTTEDTINDNKETEQINFECNIDDVVLLQGNRKGIVRYVGPVNFAKSIFYGIELTDGSFGKHDGSYGKHDGELNDKRYFKTPPNRAVFVKKKKILKILNEDSPDHNVTISRRSNLSLQSLEAYKHNELIQETEENEEFDASRQQNHSLQATIDEAKITLLDENSVDSSDSTLQCLLEKQKERMQQLMQQNQQLKNELQTKHNSYGEKVKYLTQKNQELASEKQQITSELAENDTFTLLLREEHHNQVQVLKQKLTFAEEKYSIVVESEASYKSKVDEMENEMQQVTQNVTLYIPRDIFITRSKTFLKQNVGNITTSKSYPQLQSANRHFQFPDNYGMKYVLRQYCMARLIVFGVGMWILPSRMVGSVLLATSNGFNCIYSYKYGRKKDLVEQSIVFYAELFLSKYLRDTKHIGVGIAIHGLYEFLNYNIYQLYATDADNNPVTSIIKEVGISAMLNVVIGVGTLLLTLSPTHKTYLKELL